MPWTSADVDRHTHGLSPTEQRQWVSIANAALASCLQEGGSQAACEGTAIRIASGSVKKGDDMDVTPATAETAETDATVLVVEAQIAKSDDAQQRIWGWASIAVMKDGTPGRFARGRH
jgi:hypothetical protein